MREAGAHRPELGHNCAREGETGKGLGVPSRCPSPGPTQPTCCQQPSPSAQDPTSICTKKSLGSRPAWPSQLDPSAVADGQGSQAAPAHPSSSPVPPEDLVTCALQLKTLQRLPAGGRARPHKQDRGEPVLASFQPHPRTGDAQGTHGHSPPVLATLRPQACVCGSLAPPAGQARPCMRTRPPIAQPPAQTLPQLCTETPIHVFQEALQHPQHPTSSSRLPESRGLPAALHPRPQPRPGPQKAPHKFSLNEPKELGPTRGLGSFICPPTPPTLPRVLCIPSGYPKNRSAQVREVLAVGPDRVSLMQRAQSSGRSAASPAAQQECLQKRKKSSLSYEGGRKPQSVCQVGQDLRPRIRRKWV